MDCHFIKLDVLFSFLSFLGSSTEMIGHHFKDITDFFQHNEEFIYLFDKTNSVKKLQLQKYATKTTKDSFLEN